MVVKQLQNNVKRLNRTDKDIKYIVMHDTQNFSKGANAQANFNYFNSFRETGKSSCDYIVDDKGIWKINDHKQYYTYHCGDGGGKNGISNTNSIGIEMCVNSDGDAAMTLANTVLIVRALKEQFPHAQVVRHYDASGKICPRTMSPNQWQAWTAFLNMLRTPEPRTEIIHWAESYYKTLTDKYKIKLDKRDFDKTITRGELMAFLVKILEKM